MLIDKLKEFEPAVKIILACVGVGLILCLVLPFAVGVHDDLNNENTDTGTGIQPMPIPAPAPVEKPIEVNPDAPWTDWIKPDHWMLIVSPLIIDTYENTCIEFVKVNSMIVEPNTLVYIPTAIKEVVVSMGGSAKTNTHTATVPYCARKEAVPWIVTGIGKDYEWDMIGGFAQEVGGFSDTFYGDIRETYFSVYKKPTVYDKVICWFNYGFVPTHIEILPMTA
jgi:hypothetical protein